MCKLGASFPSPEGPEIEIEREKNGFNEWGALERSNHIDHH